MYVNKYGNALTSMLTYNININFISEDLTMHWLGLLNIGGITFLGVIASPEANNEPSMQTCNESNSNLCKSHS